MKVPEEKGRYQGAAGTVSERNESAPGFSALLYFMSAHSFPCTPNRGLVHLSTLTTVAKYTNLVYQIDNMAVSNAVEHTGDRVLISGESHVHTHNY